MHIRAAENMQIVRTTDIELIRQAMTHPKIYPHVSDDGSPAPEDYEPPLSDVMYFLAAYYAGQFLGVFLFHPHNHVCYEVHTCLLPDAWGMAEVCGKAAVAWMFANTPCQRVITNVPANNRLALRLSKAVGLEQFGLNERSFLKEGVLRDQIMLGISKEASCQQQQ